MFLYLDDGLCDIGHILLSIEFTDSEFDRGIQDQLCVGAHAVAVGDFFAIIRAGKRALCTRVGALVDEQVILIHAGGNIPRLVGNSFRRQSLAVFLLCAGEFVKLQTHHIEPV